MINFISQKNNKGFTMVETLVAVAILMISIVGPLTIAEKGLTAAIYARDQVIASFLAQDAMEYIKNMRDNNINTNASWLAGITSNGQCDSTSNICTIDTTPSALPVISQQSSCLNSSCTLYNDGQGYNTVAGGRPTQFNRYFYITNNIIDTQATIIVKVEWANGTVQNAVTLENQIFNVYK